LPVVGSVLAEQPLDCSPERAKLADPLTPGGQETFVIVWAGRRRRIHASRHLSEQMLVTASVGGSTDTKAPSGLDPIYWSVSVLGCFLGESSSGSGDFREDGLGCGGPDVGLGVGVAGIDVGLDLSIRSGTPEKIARRRFLSVRSRNPRSTYSATTRTSG